MLRSPPSVWTKPWNGNGQMMLWPVFRSPGCRSWTRQTPVGWSFAPLPGWRGSGLGPPWWTPSRSCSGLSCFSAKKTSKSVNILQMIAIVTQKSKHFKFRLILCSFREKLDLAIHVFPPELNFFAWNDFSTGSRFLGGILETNSQNKLLTPIRKNSSNNDETCLSHILFARIVKTTKCKLFVVLLVRS